MRQQWEAAGGGRDAQSSNTSLNHTPPFPAPALPYGICRLNSSGHAKSTDGCAWTGVQRGWGHRATTRERTWEKTKTCSMTHSKSADNGLGQTVRWLIRDHHFRSEPAAAIPGPRRAALVDLPTCKRRSRVGRQHGGFDDVVGSFGRGGCSGYRAKSQCGRCGAGVPSRHARAIQVNRCAGYQRPGWPAVTCMEGTRGRACTGLMPDL